MEQSRKERLVDALAIVMVSLMSEMMGGATITKQSYLRSDQEASRSFIGTRSRCFILRSLMPRNRDTQSLRKTCSKERKGISIRSQD